MITREKNLNSVKGARYLKKMVVIITDLGQQGDVANACKRSLAICRKSTASCPVSRLRSVHI